MGAIQEIFRQYGPAYLERLGQAMPAEHQKVIEAICQCRTEAYGSVCYRCEDCGHPHVLPAACGNRHCPQCQHRKAHLWLDRQLQRQLPGHHFLLTFTVPEALRPFLHRHQRVGYGALFEASSGAIKTLVRDSRFVGGDQAGFFGVLHAWGRQLQYHPHIHYVVPGGALSSQDGAWHASSLGFFLPVKALSRVFRGKFRARMHRAGFLAQIPAEAWQQDWNVNCQAVPNAEASIRYLAPYVFKVAISDHRIVKVEACPVPRDGVGRVSFSYQKPGSARPRTLTLDALEFCRRFLTHVLPCGFVKVRYYGFLSPTAKAPLEEVKAKVELAHGFAVTAPEVEPRASPQPLCQVCGGRLRFHRSLRTRCTAIPLPRSAGPPAVAATA
jgi:hypothetical protein